jgi:hypothetical protein
MLQQFFDREAELRFLEDKYSEPTSQLIIIYGRRRVGKTVLCGLIVSETQECLN